MPNPCREMLNVNGYVRFQNHYNHIHVQLNGDCMEWRMGSTSQTGGQLSVDVFVDTIEQEWHANLKIVNLFAPVIGFDLCYLLMMLLIVYRKLCATFKYLFPIFMMLCSCLRVSLKFLSCGSKVELAVRCLSYFIAWLFQI